MTKKILIHTCCAPCTAPSGEKLMLEGCEITLFYSNSNIFPEEEYKKRLESVRKLAGIWDVDLKEDVYDHKAWLNHISGLENEPEKGKRCAKCFEYNLRRTSEYAEVNKFTAFTTTLTLSPHKTSSVIFEIGSKLPGFKAVDFQKGNGFLRSVELCKNHDLYRQHYCGCEFSPHFIKNTV